MHIIQRHLVLINMIGADIVIWGVSLFVGLFVAAIFPSHWHELDYWSHLLLPVQHSSYVCLMVSVVPLTVQCGHYSRTARMIAVNYKDRRCLFLHNREGSTLFYPFFCIIAWLRLFSLFFLLLLLSVRFSKPYHIHGYKTVCSLM